MFNIKWDKRFLSLAQHIATWSKDPSTQVGAVLVDNKKRVIGMGYNGFARGVEDKAIRYENRPLKYQMVIHAEANALLNAVDDVEGSHCYASQRPCAPCMALLIQSGISYIISPSPPVGLAERLSESFAIASTMADEAGVEFWLLDGDSYKKVKSGE